MACVDRAMEEEKLAVICTIIPAQMSLKLLVAAVHQVALHLNDRNAQLPPANLYLQDSVEKNVIMQEWHDRLATEAAVSMMAGRVETCVPQAV